MTRALHLLTLFGAGFCLLPGCGVEETGYLTDEGVLFTAEPEATSRLLVVRPEAVLELGGELSGVTSDGDTLAARTLGDTGTAWSIGSADTVTLTYVLEGSEDSADYTVAIDPGARPEEDIAGAFVWASVVGGAIEVQPGALIGTLPYLVVNQDQGGSVVVEDLSIQRLDGSAGDRICAASLVGDALTASTCLVVN